MASLARLSIAVLKGDGIGPDIVGATMRVLDRAISRHGLSVEWQELAVGTAALEEFGTTLPNETIETLQRMPAWILGPVDNRTYPMGDHRYVNPSGYLRKRFELYANVRPSRAWPGISSLRPNMDLVIVRENTEGFYADRNLLDGNGELRPNEDTVLSVRLVTRRASERVAQQAFELARHRGRLHKVTAVHKANILRHGDGLFLESCRNVAAKYPDVGFDDFLVDTFAMRLVLHPEQHDVVVTTNLFGDILSDEAAGLVGGLGLAPSLNIGMDHAMAQAVHGSAPDIAGRGIANPIAEILSGALLLGWLSHRTRLRQLSEAQADIESAVADTLAAHTRLTPDLGGSCSTDDLCADIISALDARPHDRSGPAT